MKSLRTVVASAFASTLLIGLGNPGYAHAQKNVLPSPGSTKLLLAANDAVPNDPVAGATSTKIDNPPPKIELVFALDTTGSMEGLIRTAQAKIWSIASSMTQTDPVPEISVGLIAYRDRGDAYVTKRTALTNDLDDVYFELMQYEAAGGGDTPESVNQALSEGIDKFKWSKDKNTFRVLFLVGDSPPKNYSNDISWKKTARKAAQKDIIINTIQMGRNPQTTPIWKEMSRIASGQFLQVNGDASGLEISTPYDEELSRLADKMDDSRIYYGTKSEKRAQATKKAKAKIISKKAGTAAKARRASYNAGAGKKKGYWGKKELIEEYGANAETVVTVKNEALPAAMQKMTADEKIKYVKAKKKQRKETKKLIRTLEIKRQKYIKKELSKQKDKGKDNFSEKIYSTVKKQAKKKNITFSGDSKH